MANTREIRRRIKSVKNTSQITKAMQMVAAAKMRKAQQAAMSGRPYALQLNRMLVQIDQVLGATAHPLLDDDRPSGPDAKTLVLTVSTDRGLCGPLNTNLLREALLLPAASTDFVNIGRKSRQGLQRARRNIAADFEIKDPTPFRDVKQIAQFVTEKYLAHEYDRVAVLYPRFRSTLLQEPILQQLLPIASIEGPTDQKSKAAFAEVVGTPQMTGPEFLFEPSARQLLDELLPHYINFELFQMILSARASEHSARMVAMKSATDNAKALIKSLTLEYNKVRQAAITNEILEISSAQAAMG